MAELFCHTDEDGYRLVIECLSAGDLRVVLVPVQQFDRGARVVDLPAVDGRRLLAALLTYYGPEERTDG